MKFKVWNVPRSKDSTSQERSVAFKSDNEDECYSMFAQAAGKNPEPQQRAYVMTGENGEVLWAG